MTQRRPETYEYRPEGHRDLARRGFPCSRRSLAPTLCPPTSLLFQTTLVRCVSSSLSGERERGTGEEGLPEVTLVHDPLAQTQMGAHAGGVRATPAQGGMSIPLMPFNNTRKRGKARQALRPAVGTIRGHSWGHSSSGATSDPTQPCLFGWSRFRRRRTAERGLAGTRRSLVGPLGAARPPPSRPAPPLRRVAAPARVCLSVRKTPLRTARPRHSGRPWRTQREPFKNVNKLIKISSFTSSCFTACCPPLLSGGPRRKHLWH